MARLENTFKKYLVTLMGTRWDVQSHEDRYSDGIPDLSFGISGVNGWIELKQIDAWPKMAKTLLKPKKYTSEQVNWLRRRGKKAGNCFVFVKVGAHDYFLFSWHYARNIRQGMTPDEYRACCLAHYHGSIGADQFANELGSGREVLYAPTASSREHSAYNSPLSQP